MSPAVLVSHSSPSSSKDVSKPGRRSESANANSRSRKVKVPRRRGRGRPGMIESDDEIERETMTDVSDSEEPSLVDSDSDSEAESDSESLALHNGRRHPDTPSTTQSPPPNEIEAAVALNGFASKPDPGTNGSPQAQHSRPAFLSAGVDWSDMVSNESSGGAAPLPVIDFSELREHADDEPPQLTNQVDTGVAGNGEEVQKDLETLRRGERSSSQGAMRSAGQSARQAYQQRLQADPSFVPTVGDFWGHDDRLLQKELRGLSGWWRGRWQGRGRGRGGFGGRGFGGRGRGGFFGGPGYFVNGEHDQTTEDIHVEDVPPVEKTWTHDGFEELKAKEEQRRAQKRATRSRPVEIDNINRRTNVPLRGGFVPPSRGSMRPTSSPTPSRASYIQRLRSQPDRPWFAMKPEHIWTKQFEGFLFSDPSLKPKAGRPAGYRVRLPGRSPEIIRATVLEKTPVDVPKLHSQPPSEMMAATDVGSRTVVVRLPKLLALPQALRVRGQFEQQEQVTTAEEPPIEGHTVQAAQESFSSDRLEVLGGRPSEQPAASPLPVKVEPPMTTSGLASNNSSGGESVADVADVSGLATQAGQITLEDNKLPPDVGPAASGPIPPPPIQTSFPPPLQPTPSYSPAPYGYAPFPPGFALNQQGFAYEVASGRPVYMHPTPPPQMPIFTPRAMPFVPGHMHHHSMSGDFMPGPPTPPLNGILDPSTGQPIFSLPRQTSRIEIRAPGNSNDGRAKRDWRPSNLRSMAVPEQNGEARQEQAPSGSGAAQPAYSEYPPAQGYYQQGISNGMSPRPAYQSSDGSASMSPRSEGPSHVQQPSMDQAIMGYPYQQQYYYPEQYYPAYVEMPQQPGQYDPYNADPRQQPPMYF